MKKLLLFGRRQHERLCNRALKPTDYSSHRTSSPRPTSLRSNTRYRTYCIHSWDFEPNPKLEMCLNFALSNHALTLILPSDSRAAHGEDDVDQEIWERIRQESD